MRIDSLRPKKCAAWLILIALGLVASACGHKIAPDPEVPIDVQIRWPINDVDDRSSTPGELELVKKVFVPGSEPSKEALPRYTKFRYKGTKIVQSGDTATVTVECTDVKTHSPASEMQWSLVKIDTAWRIKDAPLPAAVK